MRNPLRVAIIGYGHAGSVFHAPLIASTPGLRVAAIVTTSAERASQARAAYPQAQVVASADTIWQNAPQYDLAVVATPNRTHVELGLAAIEADYRWSSTSRLACQRMCMPSWSDAVLARRWTTTVSSRCASRVEFEPISG